MVRYVFSPYPFLESWTFGGLFQDGTFRESLLEYRPGVPALAGHFHCRRGPGPIRRAPAALPSQRLEGNLRCDYSRDLRPAERGLSTILHSCNPEPPMSALGQKRHCPVSGRCPLYPQKRTLTGNSWMSASCQKRTLQRSLDSPGWRLLVTTSSLDCPSRMKIASTPTTPWINVNRVYLLACYRSGSLRH